MVNIFTIILTAVLISLHCPAFSEPENKTQYEEWPAGMTLKKVGGTNVVVPEGTRVRREGDLRIVEGTGEYAARKFVDIDNRFKKIDSEISELRKETEDIKKILADIQRSNSFLKSK